MISANSKCFGGGHPWKQALGLRPSNYTLPNQIPGYAPGITVISGHFHATPMAADRRMQISLLTPGAFIFWAETKKKNQEGRWFVLQRDNRMLYPPGRQHMCLICSWCVISAPGVFLSGSGVYGSPSRLPDIISVIRGCLGLMWFWCLFICK